METRDVWSAVGESTAACWKLGQRMLEAGQRMMRVWIQGANETMDSLSCLREALAGRTVVSEGMCNTESADVVDIDRKVGVKDEIHRLLIRHCAYMRDRNGCNCDRRQC